MNISEGLIKSIDVPEISYFFNAIGLERVSSTVGGFIPFVFLILGFVICMIPDNNYRTQKKSI